MPTTFRDFVKLAGKMGPAQPLQGGGMERARREAVIGSGGEVEVGVFVSRTVSWERGKGGRGEGGGGQGLGDRSMTPHDLYELEAAHDRINELHPDYLNACIESIEDEGVSMLSTTKGKSQSSLSSLVGSTTKITVSELRNRFDPAAREGGRRGRATRVPLDMGKPSNTVTEITNIFEHKARSDRHKV
ncbi:unnamed protein product [Discosporangium mesarthrocarpum]